MRVSQEIRIIDLLARRGAEFLTVKDCEDQIRELLGGLDYPFPPPPVALPSVGRTNAKKAWRPQGMLVPKQPSKTKGTSRLELAETTGPTTGSDGSADLLPPPLIASAENAYLVHYQEKDKEGTSFLVEPKQVQSLLELTCDSFRVTKIEAVNFRTLEDYDVLRTLWTDGMPGSHPHPQAEKSC